MKPNYDKDSKADLKVLTKESLLNLRFDYAWKWFEYHAAQRVTMFNYFLLITGILASAYVVLLKEGLFVIGTGLAVLGTLTSIGFLFLDCRNKQLVDLGEDVLEKLERYDIFTTQFRTEKHGKSIQLGFLLRESEEAPRLDKNPIRWFTTNIVKHKFWIRTLEGAVAACFVAATVIPVYFPSIVQSRSSADMIQLQGQLKDLDAFVKRALVSPSSTPAPVRPQVKEKREKGKDEKAGG